MLDFFTVAFDQLYASLLNKMIFFYSYWPQAFEW